jgi:hypothetical protein
LILGRLSLKYFKREIEILGKLEDLLNIKNIESFNLNNLNEKKSKILS